MSEQIPAAELAARFVTLCTRGGTGRDWPRKQRDRWILLRALQARLVSEASLGEREVTARIQDWLLGPGRDFAIDAVSLRRALVDEGFLDRDDYGRAYRVSSRHEHRVRFEDMPPDLDERVASRRAT